MKAKNIALQFWGWMLLLASVVVSWLPKGQPVDALLLGAVGAIALHLTEEQK